MFKKLKEIDLAQLSVEIKNSFKLFVVKPFLALVKGEKKIKSIDDLQDYIQPTFHIVHQHQLYLIVL